MFFFTLQPKCEIETICGTHYPKFSSTDRLIAYAIHYIFQYNRVTHNYDSQLMSHSHQCPVSYLQLTMLHFCQCPVFYLLTTWSSSVRLSIKFATTKYCWNQIICTFTYNRSFKSSVQTEYIRKHFSNQHWNMQWHYKSDVMNYNYSMENKGSDKSLKKCLTKIHSEVPREEIKKMHNLYSW